MKPRLAFAGSALMVLAASAAAQGSGSCFIEVRQLVAPPPGGLAELHGAIGQLDASLRPQVDELKRLNEEVEGIDQRHQRAMSGDDDDADLAALDARRQELGAEIETKHARLREDYASQQAALVGPVQERVARAAQAFGKERGCSELKMARGPDMDALQSGGARNLTGEFVTWYGEGQS